MTMSTARDERLTDLARRILAGEAIDWEAVKCEDPAVVAELRRLQALVAAGGDSTGTAAAPSPEPPAPPPSPPPKKHREDRFIGDFRLVRTLGEGGMGVVYEAEQQHPRRPVALKVIRGGQHVGPDTLKLFQREAQTLARLRHPGIAALYETGVTDDGLHFFAMELVRGPTLSAWIRQRPAGPLTPEEVRLRLSVFKKICDAVAYAHQRGVIHRDLKPGNVLIPKETAGGSFQDPVPDVKVLDFGLARITDSDVQATTYVTEMGKVQGTLPYMSPEQVRGNPDEIDLRTDVYSLGVLLYEMVTGRLPYDVSKAQLPEAVRIICEQAPKSITSTFSGMKHLHADVITIAGKCLEKDPTRRYQSAAALGEDVARYLSDQPILARPPSATYQLRKLVARHKGPFAFAVTVFVLVTALAAMSTVQALRISKERDRANQEAETAKQISEFLEGLFKVADPSEARGNTITAREILDKGADQITRELSDRPGVRARLMLVMARVYNGLALFDKARELVQVTLPLIPPEETLLTADTWELLGTLESTQGRATRAHEAMLKAYGLREKAMAQDSIEFARAVYFVGYSFSSIAEYEEAETHLRRAMELADRHAPAATFLRIWTRRDLGWVCFKANRLQEGERWSREALDIADRELPPDEPERIGALNSLGFALGLLGRSSEGRPYLERAVALAEKIWGPESVWTANIVHSLAELERRAGNLDRAIALLERILQTVEQGVGKDSKMVAMVLDSLAPALAASGKTQESELAYRRLLDLRQNLGEADTSAMAGAMEGLASVLEHSGQKVESGQLAARARELRRRHGSGFGVAMDAGGGGTRSVQ
jgi:serine/threonine protein kinase